MKTQDMNIVIAESLGWDDVRFEIRGLGAPERKPTPHGLTPVNHPVYGKWKKRRRLRIPDYCNDLNAMHEVEKSLTHMRKMRFVWHLHCMEISVVFATARQRSEAYLRTLNLWED